MKHKEIVEQHIGEIMRIMMTSNFTTDDITDAVERAVLASAQAPTEVWKAVADDFEQIGDSTWWTNRRIEGASAALFELGQLLKKHFE